MSCPVGKGMAVCTALGVVVVSSLHKLTVYSLAPGFPMMHKFGTQGVDKGQFKSPFHMCFTPWGANTVLVAEQAGNRVQEVDVMKREHVAFWCVGAGREVVGPRGVAACMTHVAVSEWKKDDISRVSVFDRTSGALVRRSGSAGGLDGQLKAPGGVRFSRDGLHVIVADDCNRRVCLLRRSDGSFVRHVVKLSVDQGQPADVEELEDGGYIVSSWDKSSVYRVSRDGSSIVRIGGPGTGRGEFAYPMALASLPGGGCMVRERDNGGRLQALGSTAMTAVLEEGMVRVHWDHCCAIDCVFGSVGCMQQYLLSFSRANLVNATVLCSVPLTEDSPS